MNILKKLSATRIHLCKTNIAIFIVANAAIFFYHLIKRLRRIAVYSLKELTHGFSLNCSKSIGVNKIKRNPELIVSLTTIPERISKVALCIDTLLSQSLKPDRLILWLSESNTPGQPVICKDNLPKDLVRLMNRGLEIRWCEDIGSYRKIIPTLRAFPDALIVTADDDIFYPRHWLKMLYEAYQKEPQYVHCHRAHQILYDEIGHPLPYRQWDREAPGKQEPSLDLFPTTGGGVLYAPGHLHSEVLNESVFLACCPKADDIWLKAMTLMAKVQCKKVSALNFRIIGLRIPNNRTLQNENVFLNGNDRQIDAVAAHYNVFRRDESHDI